MSILRALCALPFAAAVVVSPVNASATIFLTKYSGTLTEGFDNTGLTGAADPSNLAGVGFEASLYFDTDTSGLTYTDEGDFKRHYGTAKSFVTIGEMTWEIDGFSSPGNSVTYRQDSVGGGPSSYDEIWSSGAAGQRYFEASLYSQVNDFLSTSDLTQPFTYATTGTEDSSYFFFQIEQPGFDPRILVYASNTPMSVTVSVVDEIPDLTEMPSPVPEPATWGLMIAGFALTGAMLRRRRAVAA